MLELPQPIDDGLEVADVGPWSRDKHYFLRRYIDAFTVAMKKKKWDSLHYIDLFAGPGVAKIRTSKDLIWGSPLIAAHCDLFSGIHVCEKEKSSFEALSARLDRVNPNCQVYRYEGDCNGRIQEIVNQIPQRSLSLAFLDPKGLHLDFDTLRALAKRRVDLILYFPDLLDAVRNLDLYSSQPNSNLDRCLGVGVAWRDMLGDTTIQNRPKVLREMYVNQIRKLGYQYFDYERISNTKSQLYLLIYCCHDPAGLRLWVNTSRNKPDGQRTFDFRDLD